MLPPLAVPIAMGLQVMSMFPATISVVAEGVEVAFESPTVEVPVAVGEEEELALPPFVVLLVVEFALALEPPPLSLDDVPVALALALLPFVSPVVAEFALEPEPVMAAAATEIASASALERPVIAWPLRVYETVIVPQLADTPLVVEDDWVPLDPACEPSPLPEGVTLSLLLPPVAVPSAIGLQVIVMLPA